MWKTELTWLEIDGKPTPPPRYPGGYIPVYSDFDTNSSKRNELAQLKRQCVRKDVVSPKFKWRIRTRELNRLLNMITPEKLNVKIYDPKRMGFRTFVGYAQATRQPELVFPGETYEDSWWDFECSFIEY